MHQQNPTFQQRSVEECVIFAIEICFNSPLIDIADLARIILKGKSIDETLCCISDQMHNTLLHCAARHLTRIFSTQWRKQGDRWEKLFSIMSDLIKGGSKLHSIKLEGRTPMLEILLGLLHYTPMLPAELAHYKLSSQCQKVLCY